MAELKTQPSDRNVDALLESVPDPNRRVDEQVLRKLIKDSIGLASPRS